MQSGKVKYLYCVVVACCMLLSGCSLGASVDTLLKPPSLSEEQEQIYEALEDAVGGDIALQYPRSGTNLSAFTVTDLDDDGEDEALVFYQKTSLTASENNLRIGVLDQVEGQWQSVCDIPADGTEIEIVEIAAMGGESRNRIFFGYSGADQADKYLTMYTYADGSMTQLFAASYTMFDVADLDADGEQELLILTRATDSTAASAALYRLSSTDQVNVSGKLELRTAFSDYSQIAYSSRTADTPAIFVDGLIGSSALQTEVLCVTEGTLSYLLADSETVASTARSGGYLSRDIDGDGTLEIPIQESFIGYEENASEQVKLTPWLGLSGTGLTEIARGYYSLSDGCLFLLPIAWYDTVTAITDTLTGDIVFCRYEGAWTDDMTELMRYSVVQDEEEIAERESDGYQLVYQKGKAYYYIRAAETEDALAMSWKSLLVQFRFYSN